MANCIIAQSGGPTSVINSRVVGLVDANKDLKIFDKVYAGLNGIEGILNVTPNASIAKAIPIIIKCLKSIFSLLISNLLLYNCINNFLYI